jgi:hypothetical protein
MRRYPQLPQCPELPLFCPVCVQAGLPPAPENLVRFLSSLKLGSFRSVFMRVRMIVAGDEVEPPTSLSLSFFNNLTLQS